MNEWRIYLSNFEIFKEIVQIAYQIAGIALFFGVVVAIKQLGVMKKDMKSKNERASVEKSIEYLNWFATKFIPKNDKAIAAQKQDVVLTFEKIENKSFVYNSDLIFDDKVRDSMFNKAESGVLDLANQLEFFSAAMVSGLADEKLAFNPLATSFCRFVDRNYDVYCYLRKDKDMLFTHTKELYKLWKNRMESHELNKQKAQLDEKMSKIKDKNIPILGND